MSRSTATNGSAVKSEWPGRGASIGSAWPSIPWSPCQTGYLARVAARPAHTPSMSWATLGARARTWRLVHASWSVAQLGCLGYIWLCALTGRRSRRLWAGVAFLLAEGAALIVGRGDCPVGPLQAEWGDPIPFFELVLPPRAAKAAVPILAVVSVAAIAALVLRRPGLVARA